MIPDYIPDCLHGFLWLIEPTVTLLQIVAYGGLTLCTLIAIVGSHLEDNTRNNT